MPATTLFEALGGAEAVVRLAHARHERVMADEIVATHSATAFTRSTRRGSPPTGARRGRSPDLQRTVRQEQIGWFVAPGYGQQSGQ